MLEISGQTTGKYLVLECVGHGGMSAIYKALDLTEDRTVALKVLSVALASDPNFEARFSREIEVLRTLEHPHILPILDYGEINGLAYIVMPFYQHGTLQDHLSNGITLKQGFKIIKQISEALEHAHAQGIVHRDVKPTNILLDEKGNAVLSDFGFAYLSDASLNLTGSALIGTPAYMSPEQCRGDEVDGNSDQYSLAVVMYQMATGRPPFEANTPMGLVFQHMNDPIPNPSDINRTVPEKVEDVLLKALDKNPSRRFPSVAALNQAFQAAASSTISALPAGAIRRQSLRTRIKRFRRRISQSIQRLSRSTKFRRRFRVGLAIAFLFLVPLAVWAVWTFGLGFGGANASPGFIYVTQDSTAIYSTVLAGMQAQIAHGEIVGISDDDISTAVAATIGAIPITSGDTETPGPSPTPTNTPLPSGPVATSTPTPTPTHTATPTNTPTPTPRPTMHVGDLAVLSRNGDDEKWRVVVAVLVVDDNGNGLSGASVAGAWTESGPGVKRECITTGFGWCIVRSGWIEEKARTTFTVTSVSHPSYEYAPEDDEDPDPDSNGTSITVWAPEDD